MVTKSELKTEYKNLIRKGKKEEAQKILSKIIGSVKKQKKKTKPIIRKKKSIVSKKKEKLDDLLEIKGIGKETVEDIKKIYTSISSLKKALEKDRVPLRNDIVRKLKKHFF